MCDYSLEAYRSRPAEEGEKLTLQRFPSGSMGFTAGPAGPVCDTAVCLPEGSHLIVQGIGEGVCQACGVGAVEEVVMTRLADGPYKDAVRFANGQELLLQRLDCGLTAVVVALPAARIEPEVKIEPVAAPATPELVEA